MWIQGHFQMLGLYLIAEQGGLVLMEPKGCKAPAMTPVCGGALRTVPFLFFPTQVKFG